MSIGPTGISGTVAGSSLQQRTGSEVERSKQESSQQARQTNAERLAEKSSGVGETSHDEGAGDRDADGQRIWEDAPDGGAESGSDATPTTKQSKDPTGEAGTRLDLNG